MKKIIIILFILIFCLIIFSIFNTNKKKDLNEIRVAEVAHSVFYAPFYVALEKGFFDEENLKIDLILTSGADKVSAAVLSNDVEIGFAGPEAAIYVYKGNEEDYLITFAGLTKRDGQFIVGRKKEELDLNDLKNKEIIVGRKGGMPALNFLNALDNKNISYDDININYSIDFASLSGAFISGIGDYVNLFEPNATKLEQQNLGYIVTSVGKYSDIVPYTAFFARKSYIDNNKDIINRFRNAINKGLTYVKNNNEEEIAKSIMNQFNDVSFNELKTIIKRYKENDSWFDNTYISEEAYKNLEDIIIKAKLLDNYVDYNKLVINE